MNSSQFLIKNGVAKVFDSFPAIKEEQEVVEELVNELSEIHFYELSIQELANLQENISTVAKHVTQPEKKTELDKKMNLAKSRALNLEKKQALTEAEFNTLYEDLDCSDPERLKHVKEIYGDQVVARINEEYMLELENLEKMKILSTGKGRFDPQKYPLRNISLRIGLLKFLARGRPFDFPAYIKLFKVEDQTAIVEIAKILAEQSGYGLAKNIQSYGIKDKKALIEIAKIAATKSGYGVSEHIQNFGIKDQKALIEIAKIAGAQSGYGLSQFIQNFDIEDQKALIEIAKIAAKAQGVSEYIQNYGIEDPKDLIEIAKIAARNDGKGVSKDIQNYRIKDPKDLIEIAKIAATNDGWGVSEYIQNYGIKEQEVLIEIAKIAAANSGWGVSRHIQNYGIQDQKVLVEIAKIGARNDGHGVSESIQNYSIKNKKELISIFLISFAQSKKSFEHIDKYSLDKSIVDGVKVVNEKWDLSSVNALREKLSSEYGVKFPEYFTKLFNSKKPLSSHIQETLTKWGVLLLGSSIALEDKITELTKCEDLITMLNDYRDPVLREKITHLLFDHLDQQERWGNRTCKPKASLSWVLMTAFADKEDEKPYGDLINRFYEGNNDKPTYRKLDRFLYVLQKSKAKLDKTSIRSLLEGLFRDKKGFEKDLNTIALLSDLMELGYFEDLNRIRMIGNLDDTFKTLFERELGVPMNAERYKKLDSFRNKSGLFSYISKLKGQTYIGKTEDLKNFVIFLQSILDSPENKSLFLEFRYDKANVPHLSKVFERNENLEKEWKKGSKAKKVGEIDISQVGGAPKKSIKEKMKDQILSHNHLGNLAEQDYPHLYAKLNGKRVEGNVPEETPFEKAAIALFEASPENEIQALEELLKHPSGKEFDNDVKGWMALTKKGRGIEDFVAIDTDDPADFFAVGDEVTGSCQRTNGDPTLNRGLLGYLLNGYNRIIAIKDPEGKIVARSLIRLLWDVETKKPVLYLERFYTRNPHEDLPRIIKGLAIERAKAMGLALLCDDQSLTKYLGKPASLGAFADEYVDAIEGMQKKEFKIQDSYILYNS